MTERKTRTKPVLTALLITVLAGALALPGFAAARGDRDDGGHRGDWRGERSYDRGSRDWDRRGPPHHHHWHKHGYRGRPEVVVVERPIYRRSYAPVVIPARPTWGNSISVVLNRSW